MYYTEFSMHGLIPIREDIRPDVLVRPGVNCPGFGPSQLPTILAMWSEM